MKLDVNFDGKNQASILKFYVEEFNEERDQVVCLSIIETFSADFDLAPDLEPSDIADFIQRARDKNLEIFQVFITEGNIEVTI
jgi:hypothetical protein